jgi:transposase
LFYGDGSTFSEEGYVPYGWQFDDEDVHISVQRGKYINVWGLYSRNNEFHYWTSYQPSRAADIIEYLDEFSWKVKRPTMVVLDNASTHKARKTREMFDLWQQRGLYIFFLPKYSPQLNLIERLWKEIKEGWIKPADYQSADQLFYAVTLCCAAVGNQVALNFKNLA